MPAPAPAPTAPVLAQAPKARTRNSSKTLKPDLTDVPELLMKCTKISMGTLQGIPKKPLHISISGVDISLESKSVL